MSQPLKFELWISAMEFLALVKALFFNGLGTSALLLAVISLADFDCNPSEFECVGQLSLQPEIPQSFFAILAVGVIFLIIGGAIGLNQVDVFRQIWDSIKSKIPGVGG